MCEQRRASFPLRSTEWFVKRGACQYRPHFDMRCTAEVRLLSAAAGSVYALCVQAVARPRPRLTALTAWPENTVRLSPPLLELPSAYRPRTTGDPKPANLKAGRGL